MFSDFMVRETTAEEKSRRVQRSSSANHNFAAEAKNLSTAVFILIGKERTIEKGSKNEIRCMSA